MSAPIELSLDELKAAKAALGPIAMADLDGAVAAVIGAINGSRRVCAGNRACCDSYEGGEHPISCVNWEPQLTQEEIRVLRRGVLAATVPEGENPYP